MATEPLPPPAAPVTLPPAPSMRQQWDAAMRDYLSAKDATARAPAGSDQCEQAVDVESDAHSRLFALPAPDLAALLFKLEFLLQLTPDDEPPEKASLEPWAGFLVLPAIADARRLLGGARREAGAGRASRAELVTMYVRRLLGSIDEDLQLIGEHSTDGPTVWRAAGDAQTSSMMAGEYLDELDRLIEGGLAPPETAGN